MGQTEEVRFTPCKWEEIHTFVEEHIRANNIVIESYWETHVLSSSHYKMVCGNETAGYFAIHKESKDPHKGATLWLFNVFSPYADRSQELFARVKKYETVTEALVATGDEVFLSHCLDNFSRIEKQAYFSIYTDKEIEKDKVRPLKLRLADVQNDYETLKLCEDFLGDAIEELREDVPHLSIYIAEENGEVVGFGVVEYGRVLKDIASIGIYVCEEHRLKGIAANILQQLKHIVNDRGCRAFSGCWYYNHNSKKSMESAGAYSKTRLIRFYF